MKSVYRVTAVFLTAALALSVTACSRGEGPSVSGLPSGTVSGISTDVSAGAASTTGGSVGSMPSDATIATENENNTAATSSSQTSSTSPATSGEPLRGKTVNISSFFAIATDRGTSEAGDALLDRVAEVEKKYGCKINFVVKGQTEYYNSLLTSCLAGTPPGDIINVSHKFILDYSRRGILEPLNNYPAYKAMLGKQYNEIAAEWITFDGKTYGVCPQPLDIRNLILFNKDILEQNGLEDPYALAEKGEWTWDTFTKYAKKCVRYDEDGYMTTYGFHGDTYTVIANTIASNNGEIIADVNGKYTFLMDSANSMEALNQVDKWMHTDRILNTTRNLYDDSIVLFERGIVAFMMCPGIWVPNERLNISMPNVDYGMIYFPKGPKAKDYVVLADGNGENFCIPTSTKLDKDSLIHVFGEIMVGEDFAPAADTEDLMRSKYEACMRDEESMEVVLDIVQNNRYKNLQYMIFNLETNPSSELRLLTFAKAMGAGESTPAQLVQQLKRPMQSYLDDTYNK